MYFPVTLLCRNPAEDPDKRLEQALMCAEIDGYTDATAELSKFICKLYREKNENAHLIHTILKPLIDQQNKRYNDLCDELNDINRPRTYYIKVNFEDGGYLETKINGTPTEINDHYIGQVFNLGTSTDRMVRCISVEFLN